MSETKDWRKICADCNEGEPPEDCEYYGEPNGCNSSTYGEYPTCKESLQVGNAAAMREALESVVKVGYPHNFQREAPHIRGYCYEITAAIKKCFVALAAPPRNCDRPLIVDGPANNAAVKAWHAFKHCNPNACLDDSGLLQCIDWLFAESKGESKHDAQ